jgi:hypothetical protein
VFAREAEPLAGNCCLVAGQRLSPSGEYRQPLNIIVPKYYTSPSSLAAQMKSFSDSPPMECVEKVTWQ